MITKNRVIKSSQGLELNKDVSTNSHSLTNVVNINTQPQPLIHVDGPPPPQSLYPEIPGVPASYPVFDHAAKNENFGSGPEQPKRNVFEWLYENIKHTIEEIVLPHDKFIEMIKILVNTDYVELECSAEPDIGCCGLIGDGSTKIRRILVKVDNRLVNANLMFVTELRFAETLNISIDKVVV
jgi:hypothetical protein